MNKHILFFLLVSFSCALPVVARPGPSMVGEDHDWTGVQAGDAYTCGFKRDGSLWCWGSARLFGSDHAEPGGIARVPVCLNRDGSWSSIQIAKDETWHGCKLDAEGTLWCWGTNFCGEVGDGSVAFRPQPVQVGPAKSWLAFAVHSGLGYDGTAATCAIRNDRSLWCWGKHKPAHGCGVSKDEPAITRPTPVGPPSARWSDIEIGGGFICGLRQDGSVSCLGKRFAGCKGMREDEMNPLGGKFTALVESEHNLCALKADGSVWCWVQDEAGSGGEWRGNEQLGTGWTSVVLEISHGCGIKQDGTLWCWGDNAWGQLGIAKPKSTVPVRVGRKSDWKSVAAGAGHTCGLRSNGTIWCWGDNSEGQLGVGPGGNTTQRVP